MPLERLKSGVGRPSPIPPRQPAFFRSFPLPSEEGWRAPSCPVVARQCLCSVPGGQRGQQRSHLYRTKTGDG
eukprot:1133739-Pelagomonas_calceolata.AAC.4